MGGIKSFFFLFCLIIFCGRLVMAQHENADSIVFASESKKALIIRQNDQIHFNISDSLFAKDQTTTGDLLLQFTFPGEGKVISPFGFRSGRMHTGTDVKMAKGDTIYSAYNGLVTCSEYRSGYGNLVVLQHEKNLETYYGHLSKFLVQSGSWVTIGEPVGLAGATGRATTNHLHFEIRENNQPCDPELVFDFKNGTMRYEIEQIKSLAALQQKILKERSSDDQTLTQKYIVRSGDSLWRISHLVKTSIQNLCLLNNLSETSILQVGQILMIY